MAILGLYYTRGMLQAANWPRKQGIFKKEVINTMVLDSIIDQMVDVAAGIGAGRPKLALQIIAYEFNDRDWKSADAPKIKMFIDVMKKEYKEQGVEKGEKAPHEILQHISLVDIGPFISAERLNNEELQKLLEQDFLNGLLYGLGNNSFFEAWYKHYLEEYKRKLPEYKEAGLVIGEIPTLKEYYATGEEIVHDYEELMGLELPSIPAKLLADAKKLGIKI